MIVQTVMQLWSSAATLLHHIRSIFRQEGESFWQSKAEAVDTKRPDALSYYNAIREMRAMRNGQSPQVVRLADDNGEIRQNPDWNLRKFNKYFESVFHRTSLHEDLCDITTDGLEEDPFSPEEIRASILRQRISGAVGCDGISAVMLRAAVNVLTPWLTTFFNAIQQLQYCPIDLRCGLIVPIYKRGKPVGIPKSYRPVMLLSVVRKVLTSILNHPASNGIDEYVRETQAGFRAGRSTANDVFYARMPCERSLLGKLDILCGATRL